MNPKTVDQATSPELAWALPALLRARERAEEIAIATNTALIQVEDGQVERVLPRARGERPAANSCTAWRIAKNAGVPRGVS